jgi:hypothetical protein
MKKERRRKRDPELSTLHLARRGSQSREEMAESSQFRKLVSQDLAALECALADQPGLYDKLIATIETAFRNGVPVHLRFSLDTLLGTDAARIVYGALRDHSLAKGLDPGKPTSRLLHEVSARFGPLWMAYDEPRTWQTYNVEGLRSDLGKWSIRLTFRRRDGTVMELESGAVAAVTLVSGILEDLAVVIPRSGFTKADGELLGRFRRASGRVSALLTGNRADR